LKKSAKTKIVGAMRWWATFVAVWLCGLPGALAQSEDWLVLPTTIDEEADWMLPTASTVGRALRKQGIGVWSPTRAVARLDEAGPRPPRVVSAREYEAWTERTSEAVLQLAGGKYQDALPRLEESQAFSRWALETLNRDPTRAQAVLDTCLFLVRALAGIGEDRRATRQAQECAALSPGMEPSTFKHPPNVTEIFQQAKDDERARRSALLVESEPPGCALSVNGKTVGKTPMQVPGLFSAEYRVQVECNAERPAPVHVVELVPGTQTLFVFDAFDRAVVLEPVLHLRYESPPQGQVLIRHTRELARVLSASSVVLASRHESGAIELRLIKGAQMERSWVRIAAPDDDSDARSYEQAVAALLAGRCGDFTQSEPMMVDCETGAVQEAVAELPVRPPDGQLLAGFTLAGVGGASLLSGYGLLVARKFAGDDWLSNSQDREQQRTWYRLGTGITATGPAGAALLVSAMPLVLPYRNKTPWWGWLSGGLGLARAGAAVALAVTAPAKRPEPCSVSGPDPAACVDRERRTDLALLLGVTAAPLLTIPLVYLFRKGDKRHEASIAPHVTAGAGGGALGLHGTF
jgi:hypothetical protein